MVLMHQKILDYRKQFPNLSYPEILDKIVKGMIIKTKAQLHAPEGGVTINGKPYKGGVFIPNSATEDLSKEQIEDVKEGKDVNTKESKSTKTRDLASFEHGAKISIGRQIAKEKRVISDLDEQVQKIKSDHQQMYKEYKRLGELGDNEITSEQEDRYFELERTLQDVAIKGRDLEKQRIEKQKNLEQLQEKRKNPELTMADKLSDMEDELAIRKRVLDKDSQYHKFFQPTEGQRERAQKWIDKHEPEIKELRKISVRKDGDHWGYYNNNGMRTFKTPEELKNMVEESKLTDMENLFNDELDWAMERVGLNRDMISNGKINFRFDYDKSEGASIGYTNFQSNLIGVNLYQLEQVTKDDPSSLQEVLRHEVAHYLEKLKTAPDYWEIKNKLMKGEPSNDADMEEWKKYFEMQEKIETYDSMFRTERHENNSDFSEGHGEKWQETMQVLFGRRPTHRYHGGVPHPEKEE